MIILGPSAFFRTAVLFTTAVKCLQGCDKIEYLGGYYGNHVGSFSSPGYPSAYPANVNCVWMIKVPIEYRIRLQFIDFQVESCSSGDRTCTCDSVDVYDGQLSISKTLGRFCGNGFPNTTYSSGRYMRVELTSDSGGVDGKGFSASFESISLDGSVYGADSNATTKAPTRTKKGSNSESGNTIIIVIATICVILGIAFIGLIILVIIRKRTNHEARQRTPPAEHAPPPSGDNRPNLSRNSTSVLSKPHVSVLSALPPPPYSEAVRDVNTLPPPYNTEYS